MIIYTGVGSRKTPQDKLEQMEYIGQVLALKGFTLRSGGADKADESFEKGCDKFKGKKEIYLPWKNFNNHNSPLYHICKEAYEIAERIHPAWENCTPGAKKLHARNTYQVLGKDLKMPSHFLVCWTERGENIGGTRTAIMLAKEYMVPVFNLYFYDDVNELLKEILANAEDNSST